MSSLSEWDVLAVDERGRPSNGTSEASPAGVTVDVYENYLKVSGVELWHPMGPYPSPHAGVIRSGDLNLLDVTVIAEPLPRGGLVWATWFHRGAELVGTVGTVAFGFSPESQYVGVRPGDVAAMSAALKRWAAERCLPDSLSELGLANALRYNQGDAFFARQMGHALPATPPGEALLPMLYHAQPTAAAPAGERVGSDGNSPKTPAKRRGKSKASANKAA